MNNQTQLDVIKAKIEEMKAKRTNVIVETPNIEIKDVHVAISDGQAKMYVKLCAEKRVQMNPLYRSFDGRKNGTMDKAIQELIKMPTIKAPSEGQVNMLVEMCERNGWDLPAYVHLTGGRDGSFSKMLAELIALEKEMAKVAPLTEKQKETILNMYFCPEVDFGDLNEQYAVKYTNVDEEGKVHGSKVLWTRASQESVETTIDELVTFQDASEFIYKYQVEYFKWTKNRCSASQMDKIRRLQESCKMQPMEDYQLMQFDRKTADMYITNLNLVRRDADIVKFAQEPTIDDIDRTNTVVKAQEKDRDKKDGLLHSMYAMIGMLGRDESETSIDLTDNEDIIADLALVCIDVCGSKPVMALLSEVYDDKEMKTILELMYPNNQETINIDGMSVEELELLVKEMTV